MRPTSFQHNRRFPSCKYLIIATLSILLAGCSINLPQSSNSSCQGNCTTGPGVQGVHVFVEPDAGEHPITDAINGAQKSVWLEMYILSDRNVIRALEEAANRGIDVRVMLEPHPFGGGSPARAMDQLRAAGAKVQESNPAFTLTHEKGLRAVIRVRNLDGRVAYERGLQNLDLKGNVARQVAVLPPPDALSPTYFIELEATRRRFPVGPFGFDGPMTHEYLVVLRKPKPRSPKARGAHARPA